MKITDLRTMRGPSYWSVKHLKLIVMKVDLEDLADKWSNAIPGLAGLLTKLLPGVGQPCASPDSSKQAIKHPPLTQEQLTDGEPLGHVIQHVALELQRLAGMPVYWGKSYPASVRRVSACALLMSFSSVWHPGSLAGKMMHWGV